jgi:hypothetical protein
MKKFILLSFLLVGCCGPSSRHQPPPAPYVIVVPATAPHGVQPRATGNAAVTLGWVLSSASTIQSQTLSYGVQNGVYTNDTVLAANVTQYQITGLVYSQSYWFAVKALDNNGLYSPYSVPLNYVTTNAPAVPPPPPTGLKVISAP